MNERCPDCAARNESSVDNKKPAETIEINSVETLVQYLGAVALNIPAAVVKIWKIL